ncbi:MAG: hypothetical protein JW751_29765 [Polyangiaceae bacterium]|nr:hypothetical protein [Polyangiaceae bacterium]
MPLARFFGCLVRSNLELWPDHSAPAAVESTSEPAIEILTMTDPDPPPIALDPMPRVRFRPDVATIDWDGIGRCRVVDGARVEGWRTAGGDGGRWASLLRAIALPVALAQRGRILLHGSSIRIRGATVSILGASRMGKSTVAAALAQRGHTLISDGLTVLERLPGDRTPVKGFLAWPGPASYRLWPDAIEHFGGEPARYPAAVSGLDKRAVPALGIATGPSRLERVYVLAHGDTERVESLSTVAATIALTQHAFLADYVTAEARDRLLGDAAEVGGLLSVARLERRQRLEHLAGLLDCVEVDVSAPSTGRDQRLG